MPQDKVTLRDIMKINEDMKKSIECLEEKIDGKVGRNSEEIDNIKLEINNLKNKVSNYSKLQVTISLVLGAIATYLGVRSNL